MKSASFRLNPIAIILAAVVVVACFFVAPVSAHAKIYAYSRTDWEDPVYYYSIEDALSAGYSGKTICLCDNWKLSETIEVADSKSLTIDMRGYKIYSGSVTSVSAFRLYENSSLTLTSSRTSTISYRGMNPETGLGQDFTIKSGGAVTNGSSTYAAAFVMDANSSLTLDGVAVCGNSGYKKGGAITMKADSKLYLRNGAVMEHNWSMDGSGGAVHVAAGDAEIHMDGASEIRENMANDYGGAIYSDASGTRIYMSDGSKISGNKAPAGGGIYFNYSYFNVVSDDEYAYISDNIASGTSGGGAIYVDSYSGNNSSSIEGITFKGNTSAGDGGALYLGQESTAVKNCEFTGNKAAKNGGAIRVCNDKISVDGCTITGNHCDTSEGGNEGGGVFVGYKYDLELKGVCTIKGNVRGASEDSTNNDDLFLSTISGSTGYAYITGGVENGSSVGIRTSDTSERMVGKNITTYTAGTYFADLDGYWISHGSDHNGDLWQRTGASDFEVNVNGKNVGRCKPGATVRLNAAAAFRDKTFWKWDESECTGFSPFSDYIPNIFSSTITFTMPQNDVSLVFKSYEVVGGATLTVAKPKAGEALQSKATLSWDGRSLDVTLKWLDEGNVVSTTAGYGSKYRLTLVEPKNSASGYCFDGEISAKDVTIVWKDEEGGVSTQDAHVDSYGQLNVTSGFYETEPLTVTEVDEASGNVTALSSTSDLLAVVPSSVGARLSDGSVTTFAVDKDKIAWPEGLLDGNEVADVGATAKTYEDIDLPLVATDAVPDAANHTCRFTLTVLPSTEVAAPSVSLAGGTYDRYSGSTRLSDDLTLNVTAACSAKDAVLYYSVDGGTERAYTSAGVTLTGEADKSVTHKLQVWAVRDGVKSDVVEATYVLDDTLNKQVKVKCSDTALYDEGEKRWADELTVTANMGETVSVTAPAEDGHVFSHWEWADAPKGTDLAQETLQIKDFDPKYSGEITAVYTPVVTAVDLVVDAPVAHGEFAASASVSVRVGDDGASKDITGYLSERGVLAWLTDEATAGHDTCYTATLSLETGTGATGDDGVKYEISDTPKLLVRGSEVDGACAYDAETKTLFVTFPSTGAYEYQSVETVDDVELSFSDAWSYQAAQEEGGSVTWGLPGHVSVSYKCGETEPLDVTWEVTGFDAGAMGEQMLTARGKISFPEYVDNEGAPEYITATINVAAPETVSAPVATPTSGTYRGAQSVALTCATEGATVHYTLDGSEPTADSPVCDGAITVARSCTLKARAFRDGMLPSGTASYAYVINHVVTFDSAGGTEIESQTVAYGKCATRPDDPAQAGFTFGGWLDADGNPYDFATPVDGDITLYAQWSASGEPASAHVVTFDTAGGTEVADQVVGDGQCATEPEAPTQDGFEFGGWTTEDGERYDFATPVTSDLTLYATWSASGEPASACVVTFDSAGGSTVAEQVVASGSCATKPADPTQEGFKFEGWLDAEGDEYDFFSPVTQSITLYAQWSASGEPAHPWVVTFDAAGGSEVADQTVTPGSCARRPADPANPGFKFEGWFTEDGEPYDFSAPVTGDITLYAQWSASGEPASAHVVTFDSMGGSEVTEQVVADGGRVERPADPAREGYVFTGWCTDESLNEEYYFGTEVRADLTLYAKWTLKQDDSGDDADGGSDDGSGKSDGSNDDGQSDSSGKANKRGGVLPTTGDVIAVASLVAAAAVPLGITGAFLCRRR